MPMVYQMPALPFKIAATERIKNPANNLFGSGDLPGTLTTGMQKSQKLRATYDQRAPSSPLFPYFLWGAKIADPDGSRSTTFHAAGTELIVTAHVYSSWMYSTDEADELCDRLTRLFHHQPIVMTGFTPLLVNFRVVDVIADPVGQHAIVEFQPLVQVTPA